MKFVECPLRGAFLIELTPISDDRGFFARAFCRNEFESHGLNPNVVQCNTSFNESRGTLRGMHFPTRTPPGSQVGPLHSGRVYDVIVDLRASSATHLQWFGAELSSVNRRAMYVPEGFAHGYQTLTDGAEIFYQVSTEYHREADAGVRWNDPAIGIEWPIASPIISAKDAAFPDIVVGA